MKGKQLEISFAPITSEKTIKAISLHQPYAFLITLGFKKFETRSWKTNYRGPLLICSSKKKTKQQQEIYHKIATELSIDLIINSWDLLEFGKAIVLVDLIDCLIIDDNLINKQNKTEKFCGDWQKGRYAWKIKPIGLIKEPIDIVGKQRLWNTPVIPKENLIYL